MLYWKGAVSPKTFMSLLLELTFGHMLSYSQPVQVWYFCISPQKGTFQSCVISGAGSGRSG